MLATNKTANKTSTEPLVNSWAKRYIPEGANLVGSQDNLANKVAQENFYQQLTRNTDTIISFQYSQKEFLTFHIREVYQGQIVNSGTGTLGIRCQIGEKTYTFNREHLMQMSNRECNELFQHLEIDGRQLL